MSQSDYKISFSSSYQLSIRFEADRAVLIQDPPLAGRAHFLYTGRKENAADEH